MQTWYVYILRCSDDSLYTGVTTDLQRRLNEHNGSARGGARYTRARRPVQMVYAEPAADRAQACRREYVIKQMSSQDKRTLISGGSFG